jgi:hypothetical protein
LPWSIAATRFSRWRIDVNSIVFERDALTNRVYNIDQSSMPPICPMGVLGLVARFSQVERDRALRNLRQWLVNSDIDPFISDEATD